MPAEPKAVPFTPTTDQSIYGEQYEVRFYLRKKGDEIWQTGLEDIWAGQTKDSHDDVNKEFVSHWSRLGFEVNVTSVIYQ